MKFTATRAALSEALARCELATDKASPHTTFKMMLIETDGSSQVRFVAHTETVGVDTAIQARVTDPGKFVVSPSRLASFVHVMPHGDIMLQTDKKGVLSVRSALQKRAYTIQPTICELDAIATPTTKPWSIGAGALMRLWEVVGFAAPGPDSGIPGLQLTFAGERCTLLSCDRAVLARAAFVAEDSFAPGRMMVPAKAFHFLKLIAKTDKEAIQLYLDNGAIYLETQDSLVRVLPPVGSQAAVWDDYERMMDTELAASPPCFTVSASAFATAAKCVAIVHKGTIPGGASLECGDLSATLSAEVAELHASEEIPIPGGVTGTISVRVDPDKIADALKAFGDEQAWVAHIDVHGMLAITHRGVVESMIGIALMTVPATRTAGAT